MSDKMRQTKLKAKLGDTVVFWLASMPSMEKIPFVSTVIGVGQNGYLDIFAIYTGPLNGGGRAFGHIQGAVPYDIEPTQTQIVDAGTWMPLEEYHNEFEEFTKQKDAETVERMKSDKAADRAAKEAANKGKAIPNSTPAVPPTQQPTDPPADSPIQSTPSPDRNEKGGRKIQPV